MAAVLTQHEPEVFGAAESQPGISRSLSLQLEVTDPEVVFALRKRPAGDERSQFALTALRI